MTMRSPITRWYVTATHSFGPVGDKKPYGVQHARRPGEQETACGTLAFNWPLFWDRPYRAVAPANCRDCTERVLEMQVAIAAFSSADDAHALPLAAQVP